MNKKGLSSTITIILLILLILIAIASIWTVLNNRILKKTADSISTGKLTMDIELAPAQINYNTGIVTVKVKRNQGEGNLSGVKIIMGNDRITEVFKRYFTGFEELEERTIEINITAEAEELRIVDITKISIAPLITLESGKEVIGKIEEEQSGLNQDVGDIDIEEDENESEEEGGGECTEEDISECDAGGWIDSPYCDLTKDEFSTYQYFKEVTCFVGFCIYDQEERIKEDCIEGYSCVGGQCIEQAISCTIDSECGIGGPEGLTKCINSTTVGRDNRTWQCIDEACSNSVETVPTEFCTEDKICGIQPGGTGAACFTPLECASNSDCDAGEICVEGSCAIEYSLNGGVINSVWPFFVGEYFDSIELPTETEDYTDYYAIFPGSAETRCLKVLEHVYPNKTGAYAYVRLNESETNISTGDLYELWETGNACLYV